MSMRLYAKVSSNQPVGPEIFLLALEAPTMAAAARPGQFIMLRVSPGPDPLLARPFSIHGVEGGKLLVLYQVKGKGTKLLTQARPGQELLAWGPLGRGFDLSAQNPVLVAGGMGIAPLAFLAERYGAKADEVRLLYGLPGKAGLDPLMDLLQKRLDPLNVTLSYSTEDGSFGVRGLVTFILKSILDDDSVSKPDLVHTCGPLPMLGAVSLLCADHGVPCQVSLEAPMACGVGACLGCAVPAAGGGYLRACQEGPVMDASSVDWERI